MRIFHENIEARTYTRPLSFTGIAATSGAVATRRAHGRIFERRIRNSVSVVNIWHDLKDMKASIMVREL